ncbi:MAG: hypothetical protein ACP5NS_01495 [Candidatus Pacearchaeota archaeon]
MKFLAVSYSKIFFAVPILAVIIFFFFPIKVNAICDSGETCPPINTFIKITEIGQTPTTWNVNFLFIVLEIFIAYFLAAAIISLSGLGGFAQFLVKK